MPPFQCQLGGKPGRFTATGTLDRVLTGETLVNHGAGGEGAQPSLTPLLRFEIHGVAFAA